MKNLLPFLLFRVLLLLARTMPRDLLYKMAVEAVEQLDWVTPAVVNIEVYRRADAETRRTIDRRARITARAKLLEIIERSGEAVALQVLIEDMDKYYVVRAVPPAVRITYLAALELFEQRRASAGS